jgi:hypothetical protein
MYYLPFVNSPHKQFITEQHEDDRLAGPSYTSDDLDKRFIDVFAKLINVKVSFYHWGVYVWLQPQK